MKVNRKEADLLKRAIQKWTTEDLISEKQANALHESYELIKFDWQSLSFYAFVFAIASIIISGVALLADKWLMQMLEKIVDASEGYKAIFFSVSSALLFYYGQKLKRAKPDKVYSHTAITLLAILTSAVALGYYSIIFGNGSGHFSVFIFIGALLYGSLALYLGSQLLWITALLSLSIWFGTETSYQSDWQAYFWGMNYIVRFIPFSLVLLVGFILIRDKPLVKRFSKASIIFFLLSLLIAFWMASIFGNYGNLAQWSAVDQTALLPWSFVFLLTSIFCIWFGIKYNFTLLREAGIAFLIINFYSRYFEFGWEMLHPTVFFALLGLSFWLIGKKAEKIWTLSSFRKPE